MADHQQEYAKIITRAWSDGAFKARLLSDPSMALREMGVTLRHGIIMKVVENTDSLFHLVLPPQPHGELEDEALGKVIEGTLLCSLCIDQAFGPGQGHRGHSIFSGAWSDEVFRAKLLSDPATALKEMGVTLPDGITMKVIENTASVFHLVLPPQPDNNLEDEAFDKIAGGTLLCLLCIVQAFGPGQDRRRDPILRSEILGAPMPWTKVVEKIGGVGPKRLCLSDGPCPMASP